MEHEPRRPFGIWNLLSYPDLVHPRWISRSENGSGEFGYEIREHVLNGCWTSATAYVPKGMWAKVMQTWWGHIWEEIKQDSMNSATL